MRPKTFEALKWIVSILESNNISYRIGGGLATNLYGSGRPINDIDISLSGKHFSTIVPIVREYIVTGPKHYLNEKWDCTTLSLDYHGQGIDLTDVDTLLMSNKEGTAWLQNKKIYQKYPDVAREVENIEVSLMHPRALLEYKQELSGEHQEYDRDFLRRYIETNRL